MVVVIEDSPLAPLPKIEIKEFVGNCKEFRIDCNKIHLRIIGNGNRIIITQNFGCLEVIGNTTRVKIIGNHGRVSYTGNHGKVSMGRESPIKTVGYIGNFGLLKLVGEADLEAICDKTKKRHTMKDVTASSKSRKLESPKMVNIDFNGKSSSQPSSPNRETTSSNQNFKFSNDSLNVHIQNNISLPENLNALSGVVCNFSNSIRITCSTGNIQINNSYTL